MSQDPTVRVGMLQPSDSEPPNIFLFGIVQAVLAVAVILTSALPAQSAEPKEPPKPSYQLPFEKMAARGFCTVGDRLYMFHHPERDLYVVDGNHQLEKLEDLSGWAISDVVVVGNKNIYCSRNRTLQKVNGKVVTNPIAGTSNLISIASDGRRIYLLDAADQPAILCLDGRTGRQISRTPYDGIRPVDLAIDESGLYVLDTGDRCVHQLDSETGKTKIRIQVGPGVNRGSGGIVFIDKQLYVHEADFQRLRPLTWTVKDSMVTSWMTPLTMTFVQESANESPNEVTRVNFEIPLPTRGLSQVVDKFQWSAQPFRVVEDRFDQPVALFRNIRIPPRGQHVLSYRTNVYTRAVQYDPPLLPLSSLDEIPREIKAMYLTPDPIYQLRSPVMQRAAQQARLDANGQEATDVRTLIENIAWYQTRKFNYVMDDSWDDALDTFNRGTGSCSEYSFVFSSLCRLNNIPTRLVGGIQIGDYGTKHETNAFHRWTEVYFPELGWIPVDVTKFDDNNENLRDGEFLFGTPGYLLCLSRGGIDQRGLGLAYYINRHYNGGKRQRRTYVVIEPYEKAEKNEVKLTMR